MAPRQSDGRAEQCPAREVVTYLNEFYSAVLPVIRDHGGHVNKLLGDGVLASFGAPISAPDHADRALEAAVEMVDAAQKRLDGGLRIGVGLSSGTVIAGTVGDRGKLDYTLIGDAVNTAARVEQMTKVTEDAILFSEHTLTRLSGPWRTLSRGRHVVRGKAEPLELHTIMDAPG